MRKRILSLLLAIIMTISLGTTVFAEAQLHSDTADAAHKCVAEGGYSADDTGHWKSCRICWKRMGKVQAHTYEDSRCTVCGFVDPNHTCRFKNGRCTICNAADPNHKCVVDRWYGYDDTSHWKECRICGKRMGKVQAHTYKDGRCTVCNKVDPNHTCQFEDGRCTICGEVDPNHKCVGGRYGHSTSGHWESCRICYKRLGEKQPHVFANGSCKVCGQYAPDHVHSYVWTYSMTAGRHTQYCEICRKQYGEAKPHTFVNNKCKVCGLLDPALVPSSIRVGNNKNKEMTISLTFTNGVTLNLTVTGMMGSKGDYHYEGGRIYTKEGVDLEGDLLWNEKEQCAVRYKNVTSNYGAYTYWKDINEIAQLKGMVVKATNYANGIWTVNGKAYNGKDAVMILNKDMTVRSYTIFKIAAPTVKPSYVGASGKPYLKWKAVDGAVKYYVYRSGSKSGTYQYIGTATKLNYTDTTAKPGYYYYYKVKAVNASGVKSSYSAAVTALCHCARPELNSAQYLSSSGKPYLSWGAVTGASKYYVYRAGSQNGSYKYIGSTTKTNYTDTTASAGYTYYYKVEAVSKVRSAANSANSKALAVNSHCARPVVKPDYLASSGKPYLKWSAVTGASKYEVYRAGSQNGTYKYIGSTTKTNYTDTTASAGYAYYYKVKAVSKVKTAANSAYSTVVKATCHCAKPVVKIALTQKGGPKLTWNAVAGAGKYEVYRATSKNGTYTKMFTTTNRSYTNTNARAGTTYYYKVKAISRVRSTANSSFSAIKSIRAR